MKMVYGLCMQNIADIVVICVNMPEDIKRFIVLGVADLI